VNNVLGPLAPCRLANNFIVKAKELFAFGAGTWLTLDWAKLGGYQNLTQISGEIVNSNVVLGTVGNAAGNVNLNFQYEPRRLGAYMRLDRESVGRAFAYATRISITGVNAQTLDNDKYPCIQSLSGNSAIQDALIMNSQQGPDSVTNKNFQAAMSRGLHILEALHSTLGPMHSALIANFSGSEMMAAAAVMIILHDLKVVTLAPYHTDKSASNLTYNSPNIFEQILTTISEIGTGLATGVGHLIGGVLQNPGVPPMIGGFLAARDSIQVPNYVTQLARGNPIGDFHVNRVQLNKTNESSVKFSLAKLAKMPIVHAVGKPAGVDYDRIITDTILRLKSQLTVTDFEKITN